MTTSIVVQWDRDAVLLLEFEAAGYVNAVATDLGKEVAGTLPPPGGTHTGELLAYDNTARQWWVKPTTDADTFPDGTSVIVSPAGTGTGTLSAAGASVYRLKTTFSKPTPVDPSPPFPTQLILMEYKDPGGDIYLHIATLGDIFNFGTTTTVLGAYYRVTSANQFFDSPEGVMDAQALQETRIQNLVNDWENYYAEFDPGTESKTISDTV